MLKFKSSLEQAAPSDEVGVAYSEPKYSLNVVSVYQDTPTREWAAQVLEQLTQQLGKDAIHGTWWEISRFSDSEVLTDAVLTVMRADVILISIYDVKELPVDLCVWIDTWLPRRRLPTGALIGLISVPEQAGVPTCHTRDYLRAVAHRGRLDFLLRERKLPAASRGFLFMEKTTETTNPTTPVLQEVLGHDYNCYAIGVGFQSQQFNKNICLPNQPGKSDSRSIEDSHKKRSSIMI